MINRPKGLIPRVKVDNKIRVIGLLISLIVIILEGVWVNDLINIKFKQ